MSIRERLDDAKFLYANDRRGGALLSVLIAVAASSRRRYPKPQFRDRQAFVQWMADEMVVITGVQNFNVRVPGADSAKWPDETMPLGGCFYEFVRCNLAHEASLPANVEFFAAEHGSTVVDINEDRIRLSDSWMDGLSRAVTFAVENADLFPDIAETPDDVIAWMLFGKRRVSLGDYMEQRRRRRTNRAAKHV